MTNNQTLAESCRALISTFMKGHLTVPVDKPFADSFLWTFYIFISTAFSGRYPLTLEQWFGWISFVIELGTSVFQNVEGRSRRAGVWFHNHHALYICCLFLGQMIRGTVIIQMETWYWFQWEVDQTVINCFAFSNIFLHINISIIKKQLKRVSYTVWRRNGDEDTVNCLRPAKDSMSLLELGLSRLFLWFWSVFEN